MGRQCARIGGRSSTTLNRSRLPPVAPLLKSVRYVLSVFCRPLPTDPDRLRPDFDRSDERLTQLRCHEWSSHTHFPLGTTFRIRGLEVFYGMGSRYFCELASLVSPNKWYGLFGRCAPGQRGRPRHVFVGRASGSAQPPRLDHSQNGVHMAIRLACTARSGARINILFDEYIIIQQISNTK